MDKLNDTREAQSDWLRREHEAGHILQAKLFSRVVCQDDAGIRESNLSSVGHSDNLCKKDKTRVLQSRDVREKEKENDKAMAYDQELDYKKLSRNEKKKWLINWCKAVYQKAVSVKTYDEFLKNVLTDLTEICELKEQVFGFKYNKDDSIFSRVYSLSPYQVVDAIKLKHTELTIEGLWDIGFSYHLEKFLLSNQKLTIIFLLNLWRFTLYYVSWNVKTMVLSG